MPTFKSENFFPERHPIFSGINQFKSFLNQNKLKLPDEDSFDTGVEVFDFISKLSRHKEISVFESPVTEIEHGHKVIKKPAYLPSLVEAFFVSKLLQSKIEGRRQANLLTKPFIVDGHKHYAKFYVDSTEVGVLYFRESRILESLHGDWFCTF